MKIVLLILAFLVLVSVLGAGVYVANDDSGVAVDVAEVARETDDPETDDIKPGNRPQPGTYTFTGSGKEAVTALGGDEHVYPEEIAVTVALDAADDCAYVTTIQYLRSRERSDQLCVDGSTVVERGYTSTITFFNSEQEDEWKCDEGAGVRLPADAKAGDKVQTWKCVSPKSTFERTGTVVGTEAVKVGDTEVEALHVRITAKLTGDQVGNASVEYWYPVGDTSGLFVRTRAKNDYRSKSVIGETQYREDYDYTATSLEPR